MNTQTQQIEIDPAAPLAPSGKPWGIAVRTCAPGGKAYGGFVWSLEVGAVVTAPDFDPAPTCGKGLHLNAWGIGNWALHSETSDALWLLVRFDPELAIDLDGDKIKVPWAIVDRVEPAAKLGVILHELAKVRAAHLRTLTSEAMTSGYRAHAATSGDRAHAATSGDSAHAATSGDSAHAATSGDSAHAATSGYSAHAATSGYRAHAATSGYRAHAATSGYRAHAATSGDSAHAATSGYRAHAATSGDSAHAATTGEAAIAAALGGWGARAKAGAGGAIVLAEYEWDVSAGKPKLLGVFASKVGENGVEPDTWYELKGGKAVAVQS